MYCLLYCSERVWCSILQRPHPNTPSDAEDPVLPASTVVEMLEEDTKQLLERDESDAASQSSNVSGSKAVQREASECSMLRGQTCDHLSQAHVHLFFT